ncbi:MAG: hypothetical protein H0X01_09685 [Nitrospira sp.]|nr:hypothetical protein [Nitrospira sp.]
MDRQYEEVGMEGQSDPSKGLAWEHYVIVLVGLLAVAMSVYQTAAMLGLAPPLNLWAMVERLM